MTNQRLAEIYALPSWKQPSLEVKLKEYADPFTLELVGRDQNPDCNISHFGYNLYFRTGAGLKSKAYKSVNMMRREVIKRSKALGLQVEYFIFEGTRQ